MYTLQKVVQCTYSMSNPMASVYKETYYNTKLKIRTILG